MRSSTASYDHVEARSLVSLVATPAGAGLYRSAGFSEESRDSVGMFRRGEDGPPPP